MLSINDEVRRCSRQKVNLREDLDHEISFSLQTAGMICVQNIIRTVINTWKYEREVWKKYNSKVIFP